MIFHFTNGAMVVRSVGTKIVGLTMGGERPINVTLTQAEIRWLIQFPNYLTSPSHVLKMGV